MCGKWLILIAIPLISVYISVPSMHGVPWQANLLDIVQIPANKAADLVQYLGIENRWSWSRKRQDAAGLKMFPGPQVAIVRDDSVAGIPYRFYDPYPDSEEPLPLMIYFHGGGWTLGHLNLHDAMLRRFALGASAPAGSSKGAKEISKTGEMVILSVDYRLAPEHVFPAAYDDSLFFTEWVLGLLNETALNNMPLGQRAPPEYIRWDTSRVFVGGDSSGGNLAAAVALAIGNKMAEKGLETPLKLQLLIYPAVDAHPSRLAVARESQCKNGPVLPARDMEAYWANYLGNLSAIDASKDITISPLAAPLEMLRNTPKAIVLSAQYDILRPEVMDYAEKLQQAGVETITYELPGTYHGFLGFTDDTTGWDIFSTPLARQAVFDLCKMVKDALALN